VLLGGLVLWVLDDSIRKARWLTDEEKDLLEFNIASEARAHHHYNLRQVLLHSRVWMLCVVDFAINVGLYAIGFWLPQIIKDAGVANPLHIGLMSAIPWGVAVMVMIVISRNSDRTRERRWHLVLSFLAGAIGIAGCGLVGHSILWSLLFLTIATSGILSCFPIFWTLPSEFLSGVGVAAAIGLINCTGNLGGFASPYLIGVIKDATHSQALGLYAAAASLILGAVAVMVRKGGPDDGERPGVCEGRDREHAGAVRELDPIEPGRTR